MESPARQTRTVTTARNVPAARVARSGHGIMDTPTALTVATTPPRTAAITMALNTAVMPVRKVMSFSSRMDMAMGSVGDFVIRLRSTFKTQAMIRTALQRDLQGILALQTVNARPANAAIVTAARKRAIRSIIALCVLRALGATRQMVPCSTILEATASFETCILLHFHLYPLARRLLLHRVRP